MLNAAQRLARTGRVGASEVPALLGLSPYAGPADVYDRVHDGAEVDANLQMRAGNYLERHILHMAKWQGLKTYACARPYVHPSLPLSASPDAYSAPHRGYGKGLAEAKLTGAWAPGIERPPAYVEAQVQTQLLLTGRPIGWVVALQGSRLTILPVEADSEYHDRIEYAVAMFHVEHLRPGIRPTVQDFAFTTPETAK